MGILSTLVLLRTLRQKRGQLTLHEVGKKRKMKQGVNRKNFHQDGRKEDERRNPISSERSSHWMPQTFQ